MTSTSYPPDLPKKVVGVMGASHGHIPKNTLAAAYATGREIALHGCVLLTGGTLGTPEQAVKGAKSAGGTTVAISPARNLIEHVDGYHLSPLSDINIFTGIGDMGRNVFNIRSSDAVVFIGGGFGTLAEFATGYAEGKPLGILIGTKGIADEVRHLMKVIKKPPKNAVLFDSRPEVLVRRLVRLLEQPR